MTFKQVTDSFNRRFSDLTGCFYDCKYKFNHLEPDSDSDFFEYDSDLKKEYAVTLSQCYRDLIALSGDIHTFCRFATKDSEKAVLWELHIKVNDYCFDVSDFVSVVRSMYHWDY